MSSGAAPEPRDASEQTAPAAVGAPRERARTLADLRQSRPERPSPVSLRTIVSWITALVAGVALAVSASLVLLTTFLGRTTEFLAAGVESVRLAEAIQIDLLLHSRATDSLVQQDFAGDLRRRMDKVAHYVTTAEEAAAMQQASASLDAYLSAPAEVDDDERERLRLTAYSATQQLVDINVAQAQAEQANARWWDWLGNIIGGSAAALLLLVVGLLIWWLRTRAFRPLWNLTHAMESFGTGDPLARAEEEGPAELREAAQRFNLMAGMLAARQQAQLTFLGGVAHDLRNPLCALRMAVSASQMQRQLSEEAMRQTLALVGRQTAHLERMVGDFLDIARIEAGELELYRELRDLRDVVRNAAELFSGFSPRHTISLITGDDAVPVRCDALRIEQVLVNLLSNAIKYSPAGGVVVVAVAAAHAIAVVSVRDEGVGMRPEDLGKIFEPFTRVGLARETIPGAGLGLFVVQKIVHAHGGRVTVESTPGRGSTFKIHLPLAASELRRARA